MPRKLKVFRTPIGFHDAYVAAPSRKAALDAWGADVDLFARGAAELVEDDALTREPLAHPGEVIRRARGSTEDHLAALARTSARAKKQSKQPLHEAPGARPTVRRAAKAQPKPAPRPDGKRVDEAEAALAAAEARHAHAEEELRDRERALDNDRRALREAYDAECAALTRAAARARADHEAAMARWRAR